MTTMSTSTATTYLLNGKFASIELLPQTLSNRGFAYADGFFETIRVINGFPQNVSLHFSRISDSLKGHRIDPPSDFTESSFLLSLRSLCEANGIDRGGYIRANFFRGEGGKYRPDCNDLVWIAEASPLETNAFELNTDGVSTDIYPEMKKSLNRLSNFKNIACSLYVQSALWSKDKGIDEALITNHKNQIIESTSSNLFLVSNRVLYTPELTSGPVGGVMRAAVINLALENNIKVYECNLTPQELLRADELFLTNAIRGIQWVGSYRTKRYFSTMAQRLVAMLNASTSIQPSEVVPGDRV
jgi:branched-subunit amino acid aminotransferase/4-amino-4-deoxychorismate lyase